MFHLFSTVKRVKFNENDSKKTEEEKLCFLSLSLFSMFEESGKQNFFGHFMIKLLRHTHLFARRLMSTTVKIGTHNGSFHCDEIFACFLLKTLPRYANAEIVR